MNRYIVLRESGASELLLIDKSTGRVCSVEAAALENGSLTDTAGNGAFSGIDMAVVLAPHPDVSSRMFYRQDRIAA
jgi:hypothetical protein